MTVLVMRVSGRTCAVPLAHVLEVMRPLPIVPVAHPPPFALGAALVRGESVPVIDLAALLGTPSQNIRRFVSVRAGTRRAVLAVDEVCGLAPLDPPAFVALPPLLGPVQSHGITAGLGGHDRELYVVLESSRLIPDAPGGGPAA